MEGTITEERMNSFASMRSKYEDAMWEAERKLREVLVELMEEVGRVEFDLEDDFEVKFGNTWYKIASIDYCNGEIGMETEDELCFFLEDIQDPYQPSRIIDEVLRYAGE